MSLNAPKILIDQLWDTLEARANFISLVKEGNRVKTEESGYLDRLNSRSAPADFPCVFIFETGSTSTPVIPTFGYGTPVATLDYGVKTAITLDIRIVFDFLADTKTMPLEMEVVAGLNKYPIDLRTAYRWAGVITPLRTVRRNESFAGRMRTVSITTVSVNTQPNLSQLIS